jgi:hypothetical protein
MTDIAAEGLDELNHHTELSVRMATLATSSLKILDYWSIQYGYNKSGWTLC